MKNPGCVVWCLLGLLATDSLLAQTITAPTTPAIELSYGKVQAFIVAGNVSLVAKDGTVSPLKRGETFEEGTVVKVGAKSAVMLVMSNGIKIKALEYAQISIDEFKQAPFDETAEGTFLRLKKDPSKSIVTLDLRNARAQFRAMPLNEAAGSSFHINTPVGSFSAHGGIFSISIKRNPAGQVIKLLGDSFVGALLHIPSYLPSTATTATNQPITIPAGGQIQIQVSTASITGGEVTGIFSAGIPQDYSQTKIDEIWKTIDTAQPSASSSTASPKASPPTLPAGWSSTDFDPDPTEPPAVLYN